MKKLFLGSIGFVPETNKEFFALINKKPSDIKVGFIPTASDVEKNKSYVERDLNDMNKFGMDVQIVDLKDENVESLFSKLSNVDMILVEGGNTFYLLDWVRKSGFDKILGKLLDRGIIYRGISAGSYIAAPTIESAGWKRADRNVVGLKNLNSLNLVPFIITAHFKEDYREAINKGVSATNLPVVAITDQQAIIVEGVKYRVVGQGERNFFNGFEEVI